MRDRIASYADAFKIARNGMGEWCTGCSRTVPEVSSDGRCQFCDLSRVLANGSDHQRARFVWGGFV